jgi:hypothetical protein
MPYRCSYCEGIFCSEHRLPENHNCSILSKKGSWKEYRKMKESKMTSKKPTSSKASKPNQSTGESLNTKETQKPVSKTTVLILIFLIAGIVLGWNYSFTLGYSKRYSEGYEEGITFGEENSFEFAYREGFDEGNDTGLMAGYDAGYKNGTQIGKDAGYQEGYEKNYETGYLEGNQTGYSIYYQKGLINVENRAFNLREPKYNEVLSFIRKDKTDQKEYHEDQFVCHDFSATVKTNAFYIGIHCYYVSIDFNEGPGHAIVAFDTSDRGLVFFEPQDDEEMDVDIGVRYWRDNGDYLVDTDDTITGFELIW